MTSPVDIVVVPYVERFTLRERVVNFVRSLLGITGDMTAYQRERAKLLEVLDEQNRAMQAALVRLENLEKLTIEDNRLIQFHHEVLMRWAAQSATLRDIEEVHAKKLKRAEKARLTVESGGREEEVRQP